MSGPSNHSTNYEPRHFFFFFRVRRASANAGEYIKEHYGGRNWQGRLDLLLVLCAIALSGSRDERDAEKHDVLSMCAVAGNQIDKRDECSESKETRAAK